MALNQKGLYTNSELVDSIIVDLNNLIKLAVDGQFIQCCTQVTMMSQKLVNLRKTIDNDLASRDKTIEELKAALRGAGLEVVDIPANEMKGAKDNGGH